MGSSKYLHLILNISAYCEKTKANKDCIDKIIFPSSIVVCVVCVSLELAVPKSGAGQRLTTHDCKCPTLNP